MTQDTLNPSVIDLTPEEVAAVIAARERMAAGAQEEPKVAVSDLAQALIKAIETTRPPQKKAAYNRKPKYTGPKLKRVWQQHGGDMNQRGLYPEEIELLNQVKPGVYCKGLIHIVKNKDRSYNITWPVKTAAQRLRVLNEAGGTFAAILRRCIDEYNDPKKFRGPDDDDE